MNLKQSIQNAYDHVHAPADVTERLKQELYQKDLEEERDEVTYQAAGPQKPAIGRYFVYIAASLLLCAGGVLAAWSMQSQRVDLNPGRPIPGTVTTVTDSMPETTEPTDVQN